MAINFLMNSVYTLASAAGTCIKIVAVPLIINHSINYVAGRIVPIDAAMQQKQVLAKQYQEISIKIIESNVLAQYTDKEIEEIKSKIKIIDNDELNEKWISKIINFFISLFSLDINQDKKTKKLELKNQIEQLEAKSRTIQKSLSEMNSDLIKIKQTDAELNGPIQKQQTIKQLLTVVTMFAILPTISSIPGYISTLLSSDEPPSFSLANHNVNTLNVSTINQVLSTQPSTDDLTRLATTLIATCWNEAPSPCSFAIKQPQEIQDMCKLLKKRMHPDVCQGENNALFRKAYTIINRICPKMVELSKTQIGNTSSI